MKRYTLFEALGFMTFIFFFANPSSAVSEEAANNPFTLDGYVRLALEQNPGLKASFETYMSEKRKVGSAGTLPDPKLSYANFIRSVETRVGPQEHKIGISQSIPWFGKLSAQSEVAEENAKMYFFEFEMARLRVTQQVKHVYYRGYYLQESIGILKQNLGLVERLERVIRSRYRAGIGSFSDLIRAQVELEKLRDRLATTEELLIPTNARLNALLNRSPDAPATWPVDLEQPRVLMKQDAMRGALRDNNPGLKKLDALMRREKKRIALAKKEGLPDFTLGFDYILTGPSVVPTADSGKDPMIAMLTLDVPLWRGKYGDLVSEARRKENAARRELEEKLNRLYADLAQTYYEASDALRKIRLYRDNLVPKALQSFEATKRGYEAGKVSFSDLIDSERLLLEFKLNQEKALVNAHQAWANLERLVGKPIDTVGAFHPQTQDSQRLK